MTILKNHIRHKSGNYKTVCATAVITSLGIRVQSFHSTSTRKNADAYEGVIRRNGFALRSRKSFIKKGASVGAIRKRLAKLNDPEGTVYLVRVARHVILLAQDGSTIVDTAPQKRDCRTVLKIHAIWPR